MNVHKLKRKETGWKAIMDTKLFPLDTFMNLLQERKPAAFASILGGKAAPLLMGTAYFYETPFHGLLIEVDIGGLPYKKDGSCGQFYGMHIHENGDCSGDFGKTKNHYNPLDAPHPGHSGDLPPLLGNHGYAYSVFYTCRLQLSEIVNRSIIIHDSPDDFTTQPSGNSGSKIGCGVIQKAVFP